MTLLSSQHLVVNQALRNLVLNNTPQNILVVNSTQRIVVNPATQAVSVILAGPVGPIGPVGPAGPATGNYEHIQTVLSTSWVVNHDLGFKPNVSVFDTSGVSIEANVIYHTINQVEIQFLTPRAGTARFS